MEIIEKYAPKVILHKNDLHRPMDVETFIAGSKLYDDNEQIILSSVTLDDLTNPSYNQSSYSLGNYDYQGNYYGPPNVQSDITGDPLDVNNEVTSKCYVKVLEHEGFVDIVYSFFYQWNGFQVFRANILDLFTTETRNFEWRDFARHEGDWEHVTVRLAPSLDTIIGVFGAAHGNSTFYSVASGVISFDGTHPIMYAALNSHATYPTEGVRSNSDITTFPVFSILWLKDADVTGDIDVNTYESDPTFNSITWNTWNNILWVDHPSDSTDAHKWLNFIGDYGVKMPESQIEDTPSLPGNAESDLYVSATVGGFVGLLDDYIHKSGPSSPLQQTNWWEVKEEDYGINVMIYKTAHFGSGDLEFDDSPELYENTVLNEISIRTGVRVDQVTFLINDTTNLEHGGSGGTLSTLSLAAGENITQIEMYKDSYGGSDRVFWIKFTTNLGNTLEGGTQSGSYLSIPIPAGKIAVGMYGKSGTEIDNLGFLLIDEIPIEPCTDVTGIDDASLLIAELNIYPNPTEGNITVESTSIINELEIYSLTGKGVYSAEINNYSANVDLSSFSPGIYILKVLDSQGTGVSKKLIVN